MSRIGWVDFSSDDREKTHAVLALLREPGTLDELGIGQVRDAFSDALFPGLSTIQTGARYFLAVPKILLDWAELPPAARRKRPLAEYLRAQENELAALLKNNLEQLGERPERVIGHTRVLDGGVERRPSSTYWAGLRILGIVNTAKSLAEFCREWQTSFKDVSAAEGDEGHDDAHDYAHSEVRLPSRARTAWTEDMTMRLTQPEAAFLTERFKEAKGLKDSVAAQLLTANLADRAIADTHSTFAAFSNWASKQSKLSEACRRRLTNAQRFSEAMEGAHILYNKLLAQKMRDTKLQQQCVSEFHAWQRVAQQSQIFNAGALDQWLQCTTEPLNGSARAVRVKERTKTFLHEWNREMCGSAATSSLEQLVYTQAVGNKPSRSLLLRLPQAKAEWYGIKKLEYRWSVARGMLRDLREPI
ncbi:hypothetical protein J7U46_09105 [Pelomonas sp. V22]|uniref:DUF6361 family protein n=1 Tax=Pelomonas sp. V22 TaxID=2822139 RepID=UPI0024A885BE|nr:DUF6361 family protein [Pelomonas sp. V22]MDI4633202.1 hypothetical protein [Pelomonas sp. V22]